MAITKLSTGFKDDIMSDSAGRRKYQMIQNEDGTVSFVDVTDYSQTGSSYGAKEVNEEREAINAIIDELNKKQTQITGGTAEPTGGNDGDVYIQFEE